MMNRNADFIRNKIVSFSKINGKKNNVSTTVFTNGTFFRDGLHSIRYTSILDENNAQFCEYRRHSATPFKCKYISSYIGNLRCRSVPFSKHSYPTACVFGCGFRGRG